MAGKISIDSAWIRRQLPKCKNDQCPSVTLICVNVFPLKTDSWNISYDKTLTCKKKDTILKLSLFE